LPRRMGLCGGKKSGLTKFADPKVQHWASSK
jgi:hypothetical protein